MIITFHSLEERLVSQSFAKWKKSKLGDHAVKKPNEPTELELQENSRSTSAKLYSFMFD
jgi:16S rRNA (cytosine1402-N4)-methyltransferase